MNYFFSASLLGLATERTRHRFCVGWRKLDRRPERRQMDVSNATERKNPHFSDRGDSGCLVSLGIMSIQRMESLWKIIVVACKGMKRWCRLRSCENRRAWRTTQNWWENEEKPRGSSKGEDEIKRVMKLRSKLRFLILGTFRLLGPQDPQN